MAVNPELEAGIKGNAGKGGFYLGEPAGQKKEKAALGALVCLQDGGRPLAMFEMKGNRSEGRELI